MAFILISSTIIQSLLFPSFTSIRSVPTMQYRGNNPSKAHENTNINKNMNNNLDRSIIIQGGSLRTWSYKSHDIQQVQIQVESEGRPLDSDIELWNGPDNTPLKMRVFVENGKERPFNAVIETPQGPNTVAIRNIGEIEFPIHASTFIENIDLPSAECISSVKNIQGGALRTYPFEPCVESIQLFLETDGRPLNARIELLQGPNNNKQIIELYSQDGSNLPFFCIIKTPGSGNVIRVVNTSPVEFPMFASVIPFFINKDSYSLYDNDVIMGGDNNGW